MNAMRDERIWLDPPKFWAATKNMPPADVDRLVEELFHLAESRDLESLKRFDFIIIAGRAVPKDVRRQH